MDVQDYRLGVDFGTSNTVALIGRPDGTARSLLFDGSPMLPSAVFHDGTAGLLVGRDAAHAARFAPERYEPNPKRRIDEHTVLLGDVEVAVVDLVSALLARVATEARRVAGGPPTAVTLTCPAAWAQTRRGILVTAAERAGLPHPTLVPEPVAAATSFLAIAGASVPSGSSVIVYDLGAGTFDATVVRQATGGFEVTATEGLSQAGGLDVDAAIVGHLGAVYSDRFPDLWNRLIRPGTVEERRANRLLWEDVRTGKEMLSRAASTIIHIPFVNQDAPLGRPQFEHLARPLLDSTISATRAAVNAAGVTPDQIAGIFLVGGGSRIPLVATLLHQAFGRAPTVTEQPELVVAQGSLQAVESLAMATASASTAAPVRATASAPAAPSPIQAPPAQAPPDSPPDPPRARPRARGRRKAVVAAGLATLLVAAVGTVALVNLTGDDTPGGTGAGPTTSAAQSADPTGSGPSPDAGVRQLDRRIHFTNTLTLTLVSVEVQVEGKLRVDLRWHHTGTAEWSLSCSTREDDRRESYLILAGGQRVYPESTWCTSQAEDGHAEIVQTDGTLDVWAVYPAVPERGTPFGLNWYGNVEVDDLTV